MEKINVPLDIESLEIISQTVDRQGNIVINVVSKKKHSTCHICGKNATKPNGTCLLYTSPSPRDGLLSRMPSSA